MRLVCLSDQLTVEALTVIGAEPIAVDSEEEFLVEFERLLQNKNNIILISQTIMTKCKDKIEYLQKAYPGAIVVVIPDVKGGLELDINRLVAEVVGVSFGN